MFYVIGTGVGLVGNESNRPQKIYYILIINQCMQNRIAIKKINNKLI